ncbi:MAG: M28 family peptidase [Acidobacteriota bacterium]
MKLSPDASIASTSVAVISVTDQVASSWLEAAGKDLKALQDELDKGTPGGGFALPGLRLSATLDIQQEKRHGRNVVARLKAGGERSRDVVVVGAHIDHLGRGLGSTSRARPEEQGRIHYGADDNASGTAGVLEIAQYLADQKTRGRLRMRRDVLFAAWSGEELGLLGSGHFVETYSHDPHTSPDGADSLRSAVAAYLNMDMIGRLDRSLSLQGVGSSSIWMSEIERRNAPVGLSIVTHRDSYLPTDATSFYIKGVPVLSAFTGTHEDYHTPRDQAEKLNYEGAARVARFMALMARSLATREEVPDYVAQAKPEGTGSRAGLRAYLGTIPDYAQGDGKGLRLSGVAKNGPAEKAGVRGGDRIVELAGRKIENIYDYTYAIEALKIGATVEIVVLRGERRLRFQITPGSRE